MPRLALLFVVCACAPIAGPVEAEIVDASDGLHRRIVTLTTPVDLRTGEGARFDFLGGMRLAPADVFTELRDEGLSYDALVARSRNGIGHPMRARLAFSSGVYLGEDFAATHYLTTWHIMEDVYAFADEIYGDHAATGRGVIGFYGQLDFLDELPIPLQLSDNAAYLPAMDAWMTFRLFLQEDGVPFAMNPGVVAHEFHHRVFFHDVVLPAYAHWRVWITTDPLTRSGAILRGVDEGLADVFAIAFSQDSAFLAKTLNGAFGDAARYRDVDSDFARSLTYDNLRTTSLPDDLRAKCGPKSDDIFAEDAFNFYCLGTVLARTLYEAAGEDPVVLREDILPAVRDALPEIGRAFAARSDEANALSFDVDLVLGPIAAKLVDSFAFCESVRFRFASVVPAACQ